MRNLKSLTPEEWKTLFAELGGTIKKFYADRGLDVYSWVHVTIGADGSASHASPFCPHNVEQALRLYVDHLGQANALMDAQQDAKKQPEQKFGTRTNPTKHWN